MQDIDFPANGVQPLAGLHHFSADSHVQRLEFVPGFVFALERFQQVALIAIKQRQRHGDAEKQLITLQLIGALHSQAEGDIGYTLAALHIDQ